MRSWFVCRRKSCLAALAIAAAAFLGATDPVRAAPLASGASSVLEMPSESARAEQLLRAQLMLGLSTRADNLAVRAPLWQQGAARSIWVVEPVRGDLADATELALTPAPNAAPVMVAINQVLVRFDGAVELEDAARRLRKIGLQGEIREMLAPSSFLIRTRSAMEALQAADALSKTPGVRFAHPDGVAALDNAGAPGAEIRVESQTVDVPSGSTVDFGDTTQGQPVNRVFTIFNDGDANLIIEVPTVTGDFSLVAPPGTTTITPAQSTTFTVGMDATNSGATAGGVSFLTNDNDGGENPFTIDLIGNVTAPGGAQEIRLTQNGDEVANNSTFNFPTTTQGVPVTVIFTISNLGGQPLSVGSVSVPNGYSVTTQPSTPINAGGMTTFTVRLEATSQGMVTGVMTFLNNDADENPYQVVLMGEVGSPIPNPEITMFNGDTELQSGGAVAFGTTDQGMPLALTLSVGNDGPGNLTIGAISVPPGFSLASAPAPVVGVGEVASVVFTLDAIFDGGFSGSMTLANNDQNENPFVLEFSGFVNAAEPTGGIDDADFAMQWHHVNDGSEGGNPGYDLRTPAAWDYTLGQDIIVAVMDNGSQSAHPDINDNVVGEYLNVLGPGARGDHGTAVAGLVAAESNFAGGRGTAPQAGLFLTNTFNISIAEAADAFYAANDAGAAIHTNSWGFTHPNFIPDPIVAAIQDLTETGNGGKGMNILFAATNDNRPVIWSSSLSVMPETITVGSMNNEGRRSGYSDFGPWLDFVAPGSGGTRRIFTTDLTSVAGYNQSQSASGGDFTSTFGGTSASTPMVAGVFALVHSINPDLYGDQVRRVLRHAARRVLVVGEDRPFAQLTGFSDSFGYGLVDANAAVLAAIRSLTNGGYTWPAPASGLVVNRSGIGATIGWTNPNSDPQNEFAGAILVRYSGSLLWTPIDGVDYAALVGTTPTTGVRVLAGGPAVNAFVDTSATSSTNVAYAVYTYNPDLRYSEPVVFRLFPRESQVIFFDDMEGPDPGWSFDLPAGPGGPLFGFPGGGDEGTNEWERGVPNQTEIDIEGTYSCNGQPCQLAQLLGNPIDMFAPIAGWNAPYSGSNVFATDLDGVYAPSSVHRLVSPEIDLSNPGRLLGSASVSWQELLEVEGSGNDVGRVQIIDSQSGSVIRTLINKHTVMTYQWREQWFDIRNQLNRKIQFVFTLETNDSGQFQGWYLDDFRVAATLGGGGPIPPAGPRRIIIPGFGIIPEMSTDAGTGGDITYDGFVTMDDAAELIQQFGRTRQQSDFSFDADLDGNGRIGVVDLMMMLALIQEQSADPAGVMAE